MKLEIGKFYKTRDGDKVEVLCILDKRYNCEYPLIVFHFSEERALHHNIDGNFIGENYISDKDIISEWDEPEEKIASYKYQQMKEALEFYRNRGNNTYIICDDGEKARKALEGL